MLFTPPPMPDPYPGKGPPISWATYSYDTPALFKNGPRKGERIPGVWFHCTVPGYWKDGSVNVYAWRHCVPFKH